MVQRVQEGVEVRVQFATQANWPVPDVIRERRFTVKAQYVPMAVWGPEMHRAVRARMEKAAKEINEGNDPAKPLTPFGQAWLRFLKETGGSYEDGVAKVGDGSLSLAALQFVRHGASVTAIIPHPLDKVVESEEQGVRRATVQKLSGIWVTPAVWKKSVDREESRKRLASLLKPGEEPNRARLHELYDELPPGDYYWYFFIPRVYNGEYVDIVDEMKRLGAILSIEALYAIESADDLAQLPSLKAEAEGMRRAMLEMERRHEELQARYATAEGRSHDLERRLAEKSKPIHNAQAVAVKPLAGAVPWSPEQQRDATQAKKPRSFPNAKPYVLPVFAFVGLVVALYYGSLPAAHATGQTALAAAGGAVTAVFSAVGSVIVWHRRRGVPSPKDIAKAQAPEA